MQTSITCFQAFTENLKPNFWFIVNDCAFLATHFISLFHFSLSLCVCLHSAGNNVAWMVLQPEKPSKRIENFNLCIYLNDLLPGIQMHNLFRVFIFLCLCFCLCRTWQTSFDEFMGSNWKNDQPSKNQMIDCYFTSVFCSHWTRLQNASQNSKSFRFEIRQKRRKLFTLVFTIEMLSVTAWIEFSI